MKNHSHYNIIIIVIINDVYYLSINIRCLLRTRHCANHLHTKFHLNFTTYILDKGIATKFEDMSVAAAPGSDRI